ncbi:hypothetical protein BaRGS_00014644 [Batillaria attramentaria]|uniref:Secreted protein n=1 Tax=Batillaria attramentaria TaxID=370345 RepID=A0ABD0L3S7_9CAEN
MSVTSLLISTAAAHHFRFALHHKCHLHCSRSPLPAWTPPHECVTSLLISTAAADFFCSGLHHRSVSPHCTSSPHVHHPQ